MGIIETAVVRSAAGFLPIIAKKAYSRTQVNRIARNASSILVTDNPARFLEHLDVDQLKLIEGFVSSPQFGNVVLQAFIFSLKGNKDKDRVELRSQLRSHLRHEDILTEGDLFQATDMLEELIYSSVHAVITAAPEKIVRQDLVASSSSLAAAAARNSDLLARIANLNAINEFASKLRSQVKRRHGKLSLPSAVKSTSVPYDDLYVRPHLREEGEDQTLSVEAAIGESMRAIILGDPGAGKSTLAGKLVHDLASGKLATLESQVPIMLVVRRHTAELRIGVHDLIHYLKLSCKNPYGLTAPAEALEYLLLNGRATVVIDGLDELGDSRYREAFTALVDSFSDLYPLTRVIVTSRKVGYRDSPLSEDLFRVFNVDPFDDVNVTKYAKAWFGLDEIVKSHSVPGNEICTSFLRESAEVEDLRRNPLMLSLLCVLYTSTGYIPNNRPEIYERCAELLFRTWDKSRGVEIGFEYPAYLMPAVQYLAWRILTDAEGRQALPKAEALNFLTQEVFSNWFEREPEAAQAAEDFLTFCSGRAWVLTDVGSDTLYPVYGFVHKTFLEFFAASQLVKERPLAENVWNVISSKQGDTGWELVSQLCVQILNRHLQGGADKLLDLVLSEADQNSEAAKKSALLEFCARCMQNVAPSHRILRRVVEGAVRLSHSMPQATRCTFRHHAHNAEDRPLRVLVENNTAESASRIAEVIFETLQEIERSSAMPSDFVGLMRFRLMEDSEGYLGTAAGAKIAEKLNASAVTPAVEFWRDMYEKPTRENVEKFDFDFLYDLIWFLDSARWPFALQIISSLDGGVLSDDQIAALNSLYPIVSPVPALKPTETLKQMADWENFNPKITVDLLKSIGPQAAASLLLIMIPAFDALKIEFEDEGIRWISSARTDDLARSAAVDVINDLQLPDIAHATLIRWIFGQE